MSRQEYREPPVKAEAAPGATPQHLYINIHIDLDI
jgi:hypothetical protein